jgi:hypothetical protein
LSEILTVFIAILAGWPLPLGALQVLWLNMITDVFPAMALALEPSSPDAMKRPPRDPKQPLLTPQFLGLIGWQGLLLTVVTLAAFGAGMHWYGGEGDGLRHAMTLAFMTLALAQVIHAFNARSQKRSALTARLFTNGWLWLAVLTCIASRWRLCTVTVADGPTPRATATDWGVIAGCALVPVVVVEFVKLVSDGSPSGVMRHLREEPLEGGPGLQCCVGGRVGPTQCSQRVGQSRIGQGVRPSPHQRPIRAPRPRFLARQDQSDEDGRRPTQEPLLDRVAMEPLILPAAELRCLCLAGVRVDPHQAVRRRFQDEVARPDVHGRSPADHSAITSSNTSRRIAAARSVEGGPFAASQPSSSSPGTNCNTAKECRRPSGSVASPAEMLCCTRALPATPGVRRNVSACHFTRRGLRRR